MNGGGKDGGSGAVHVHVRGPRRMAVKREAEWEQENNCDTGAAVVYSNW